MLALGSSHSVVGTRSSNMMWSPLALLFFVGFTFASTPAFKDNTEYVYHVNGRTLSSLNEVSDQYSGIFLKAKLYINQRSDGKVQGKISDAQYAQIHSHLSSGWETEVPESQLSYKQLALTQKPFQMVIEDGLIKKIIVEKEVTNWEANMIKSIASQYQLDIQGKNVIDDPINSLPEGDKLNGVFKTMEETVTGETETTYNIHKLPPYILQSEPWLAPKSEDGTDIIEVVKNKNYTNSEERPSYHYGFGQIHDNEPTANYVGHFLTRQSHSHAILTGKPSRFTIQSCHTVNKISIRPSMYKEQRGSVVSVVNVTLAEINDQKQQPEDLSDPVEIGSLVYTYEDPFSQDNQVHQKHMKLYNSYEASSEEQQHGLWRGRHPRSFSENIYQQNRESRETSSSQSTEQQQQKPKMNEAPKSPLLPYLMGYHGKSVKQKRDFDVKQVVQTMAQEIAENLEEPEQILSQSTLSKFVMLSSFVRLMNDDEIKQVAEQLYTQSGQGKERSAWEVFRDAVAEAGTGPAFLNIQQWIEAKKITEQEAADVVSTMARSVRTPTEDYMNQFFELTKNSKVKDQQYLNQTAVLAYTNLCYRVYMNKNESHNQYPVHSFGSFYTKEGRDFVKNTVIPYYSQQLQDAISRADATQVHLYITALGFIGHQNILSAFEPYLEGQKQCSQFQRMLMVVSLRRLAEEKSDAALPVLYKIYQNAGELPEIRINAAYIIFKNPEVLTERLQSMAENTNEEYQDQLNAAIKSAIETASCLRSTRNCNLYKGAQSALPLLSKKQYGADQSYMGFHEYLMKEMDTELYHRYLQIGSPDSYWPRVMKLSASGHVSGIHRDYYNIAGMTSSIKELVDVLYQQTQNYQKNKKLRSQRQAEDSKYSSAKIAQSMNYEQEEREQLENYIYSEIAGIQRLWSFDNQTIERLSETVRQQEEILNKGKDFSYTRLKQVQELALSIPTEMGFPFLYTSDMPILVRFQGKIQAKATPQMSDGHKLVNPDQITGQIDSSVTVSMKTQTHLCFVTPFDHQIYIAGFDRNAQGHLPVSANAEIDIKNGEAKVEFEVKEPHKDARLLHYSSWPYTSRSDLMSTTPVALRPNTQVIEPEVSKYRYFDNVFGKKQTGMAFRVWGHHLAQSIDLGELAHMLKSSDLHTLVQWLWDRASLQQSEASIAFVPGQSSTKKVTLRYTHDSQYKAEPSNQNQEEFLSYSQLSQKIKCEQKQRRENLLQYVQAGIKSAQVYACDMSLEFEGDRKYQHVFGASWGKSDSNPNSRAIIYYREDGEQQEQCSLDIKGNVPNTNGLDLTYSLNNAPEAKYEVRMQCGSNENDAAKVSGNVNFKRSDARKEVLTQKPLYNVCKQEMQEGNFQLPACQNMTIESNFLDNIDSKWQYSNIKRKYSDIIEGAYQGLRVLYYPNTQIENIDDTKNNVEINVRFEPEHFRRVNISIASGDERTTAYNLSMHNEYVKALLVPHPVFHAPARLTGVMKGWQRFRPTCVIDKTHAQTFSNRTYPLSLGNDWTVAMQYIPQQARRSGQQHVPSVEDQLKAQQENYVALVRQSGEQKEVLITFNHPKSDGKTVEIALKPQQQRQRSGANPMAVVTVDNQAVKFDDKQAADLWDGFVQIYALPNGEVKVEIQKAFYMIYDGQRAKFTSTDSKLRGSNKGLCGKFSHDKYEDFTVPANCVVADYNKFVKNYQVENPARRTKQQPEDCVSKVMPLYANVISDMSSWSRVSSSKIHLRNRYVEENGNICFSIRPVPSCKGTARKTLPKQVSVHCIQKSKTANYLKKQIEKGANPDFSQKEETKKILMHVAQEC